MILPFLGVKNQMSFGNIKSMLDFANGELVYLLAKKRSWSEAVHLNVTESTIHIPDMLEFSVKRKIKIHRSVQNFKYFLSMFHEHNHYEDIVKIAEMNIFFHFSILGTDILLFYVTHKFIDICCFARQRKTFQCFLNAVRCVREFAAVSLVGSQILFRSPLLTESVYSGGESYTF